MGVKKITPSWTSCGNFLLPQENMIFFKNIKKRTEPQNLKRQNIVTLVIIKLRVIFKGGRLP
jgi:hypothetical protein